MLCVESVRDGLSIKEIARAYIELQTPDDPEHYWDLIKSLNKNYNLNEIMDEIRKLESKNED
jgi:hypothetical protein